MRKLSLLALALLCVSIVACKPRAEATPARGAPPQIPYSEELAQSLDARLQPYFQGRTGQFALQTTSQELTSWITYTAARWSGMPVRDVVVWFSPDHVHFSGVITRVLVFSFRVQVHARVSLSGQGLQVSVERACVAGIALPGWARNLASRIITDTIADTGPYVRLESLEIGDDSLRASGTVGY